MHTNRPKLGIRLLTFAVLVALPAIAAVSDDASSPGVVQITDAAAAPAPVPIPDSVSAAPVPGGPRALDLRAAPRSGVRRGPYVGGQVQAPATAPHAASSCGVACEDCCPEGTCRQCCCDPDSETCSSESDSEICCCEGTCEDCCCEPACENGRIEPFSEDMNSSPVYSSGPVHGHRDSGGICKNCRSEAGGYVRIITLGEVLQPLHHVPPVDWKRHLDTDSHLASWWNGQVAMFYARNRYTSDQLEGILHRCLSDGRSPHCKLGYFIPSGCGGGGCPPLGLYSMVYPLNPHHVDRRDAGIYSAQGYGVPVTVPLAPNVEQTYNYSWGIPSSRLTPISRTVR